jgi:C4-type Zn-finger protein
MVLRDLQNDISAKLNETETTTLTESIQEIEQLESLLNRLTRVGQDNNQPFTLELLDPHGHSMIIDDSASERELSDEEILSLPTGPDPAVFSA